VIPREGVESDGRVAEAIGIRVIPREGVER